MYILNTKIINLLISCIILLSVLVVLFILFTNASVYDKYQAVGMFMSLLIAIAVIVLLWYFVMNLLLQKTYEVVCELSELFFDNSSMTNVSKVTIEHLNETGFEVKIQAERRLMIFPLPSPYDPYKTVLRKQEFRRSWQLGFHSFTYVVNSRLVRRTVFKDIPISFGELRNLHRIVKQEVSTFQ